MPNWVPARSSTDDGVARLRPSRRARSIRPLGALTLVLAACGGDGDSPRAELASATFIGRDACRTCHAVEVAAWEGSHHDLALDVADDSTVLGDFEDATFTQHGLTHRFFRRDGRYYVETEGDRGYLEEYQISHVLGVEPLQQYVTTMAGGRLQTVPLSWDTRTASEGGQRWFHIYGDERVAPGDPLFWTGINQNFNAQCAECHVTGVRKGYDPAAGTFQTTWEEIDVSCEACHGPASVHVTRAEDSMEEGQAYAPLPGGDFPVQVAPEHEGVWTWNAALREPERSVATGITDQIDTCARCHSRRGLETTEYAFGTSILDTHRPALPVDPSYFHDGQIREEVYVYGSFLQSRMYGAGVLCSDCHEPHSGELRAPGAAVCTQCHAASAYAGPQHDFHVEMADVATPDCIECHMPQRTYMVVDPRRDHSFRIPRPGASAETGAPNVCTSCHAGEDDAWAARWLVDWYGADGAHAAPHYGQAFAAAARNAPRWPQGLVAVIDDPETPGIVRAAAVSVLSRAHPTHLLMRFMPLIRDPDPLVRRAAAEASAILAPEDRVRVAGPALVDSVRGVRAAAARAMAGAEAAIPSDLAEAYAVAGEEWVEGQLAVAEFPTSRVNLGAYYASMGRFVEAEESLWKAIEMDSTLVPAWANLADLYRAIGRPIDAEAALEAGLRHDSGSAALVHARGLAHVRAGRPEDALTDLYRAVELDSASPRYAYVLVVGLLDLTGPDEARRVLEDALERHPRDPELLTLGVSFHQERGERSAALIYAQRLAESDPDNPDYQAAVLRLAGSG